MLFSILRMLNDAAPDCGSARAPLQPATTSMASSAAVPRRTSSKGWEADPRFMSQECWCCCMMLVFFLAKLCDVLLRQVWRQSLSNNLQAIFMPTLRRSGAGDFLQRSRQLADLRKDEIGAALAVNLGLMAAG